VLLNAVQIGNDGSEEHDEEQEQDIDGDVPEAIHPLQAVIRNACVSVLFRASLQPQPWDHRACRGHNRVEKIVISFCDSNDFCTTDKAEPKAASQ